jgi:hypothetical protein
MFIQPIIRATNQTIRIQTAAGQAHRYPVGGGHG